MTAGAHMMPCAVRWRNSVCARSSIGVRERRLNHARCTRGEVDTQRRASERAYRHWRRRIRVSLRTRRYPRPSRQCRTSAISHAIHHLSCRASPYHVVHRIPFNLSRLHHTERPPAPRYQLTSALRMSVDGRTCARPCAFAVFWARWVYFRNNGCIFDAIG